MSAIFERSRDAVFCPQCGASNVAGARFCAGCGKSLGVSAPQGSQQHSIPAQVSSLWSATETAENDVDVATVLATARQVIADHGGAVSEQSGSTIAGRIRYKSGSNLWIPISYGVTVSAIPVGDGKTSVRANATLESGGNLLTLAVMLGICLITGGLYAVLVALVFLPAQKTLAAKIARLFLDMRPGAGGATSRYTSPPPRPEPPRPVSPSTPSTPFERDGTADAFADLKRLAELRDLGAISTEEFEAKKAELLKKI